VNVAAAYLARHADGPALRHVAGSERLAWVALTPRFRASAHVVLLALAEGREELVLVAKVARLPGRSDTLDREAANLRAVQGARPGGFDSIPRLVGVDVEAGTHLLLETGVPGRVLDGPLVRRRPRACAEAILAWVAELHVATAHGDARDSYARLIEDPLRRLASALPGHQEAADLVARTLALTCPLRRLALPLVQEHGDLSAPNLLMSRAGALGVVDWELGEPDGLPAQDLLFAMSYLAFARSRASQPADCVAAFHDAFFSPRAWAWPLAERHAEAVGLPREALRPLFLACWSRYVARRAARLLDADAAALPDETTAWLEQDRYFALWRHAVAHADAVGPTR
jgi:aminoglycoside phosphotransferase